MLKKHMAACLLATALAAPAFGQATTAPSADRPAATGSQSTTSGSPAMVPGGGSSAPSDSSGSGSLSASGSPGSGAASSGSGAMSSPAGAGPSTAQAGGSAGQGNFVTQMQQGQWMASKLIGTQVVSANNETIGDVNDVVLDRSGTAQAVVIGVGGFLGLGEKSVAVPFRALEFASSRDATTTGSTGGASGGSSATGSGGSGGEIDRIVLRMTKADLEAAPAFQTSGGGSGSASGSGASAPRQ